MAKKMKTEVKKEVRKAAETFSEVMRKFGNTLSEILDDPEVRNKAKDFAESLVDATAKALDSKTEDEQIRSKFRNVGKAAKSLGNSLEEHFSS